MARIVANGIGIEAETFGDAAAPAILLIQGYAAQMVVWPEPLCRDLAGRGFYVIRFDNRDVGLSQHFHGVKAPGVARSFLASIMGIKLRTPYTLDDMARDTVGVLDAFNIAAAHIVGASMGGMIAQLVAAQHGNRTRSLVSIMSTSGNRKLPPPEPRLVRHVLFRQRKNAPKERVVRDIVSLWELLESPAYPTSGEERLRQVSSWVERDCDRVACLRQFAAMAANGDRTELLRSITRPALIIHGEDDPLIKVEGGRHTAECIAGAELKVIAGMAHDFPESLVPTMVELIADHCSSVEQQAATDEDT